MRTLTIPATLFLSVLTAACESPTGTVPLPSPSEHSAHGISTSQARLTPDQQRGIDSIRALTAPLRDLDAAKEAGFTTQFSACAANPPIGAMGFHWGNASRVDGTVKLMEPEVLVFSPNTDGSISLGAVEYIVPYAYWSSPIPPRLLGREFHPNPVNGLWMLHVWLWRDNPASLFADWNPAVSCEGF